MSNEANQVDRLFADYVGEHRRGGADPAPYLAQLQGADRRELVALLDGYLARQPRRTFEPEAFDNSNASQLADVLHRSLHGEAGMWPVLLPQLRDRAGLSQEAVVTALAQALAIPNERPKVAQYYEQMEGGSLPAGGVDNTVLTALADVLGTTAAALRNAGAPLIASESQTSSDGATNVQVDDVDRLFRGSSASPDR